MNEAKKKAIELGIAAGSVVLFAGAAIGGTFALFSSEKAVSNHLTVSSGIKAGLYLTSLSQDILDERGLIESKAVDLKAYKDGDGASAYDADKGGVDLSRYDGDIFQAGYIVPTMRGEATLRLYNLGDIAFDYEITTSIKAFDANGNTLTDAAVLTQVEWSVSPTGKSSSPVLKSSSSEIKVSYLFKNADDNNLAAGQTISMDIKVQATQATNN